VVGVSLFGDFKSSYVAFLAIGVVTAVAGALNLIGVMSFLKGNMPITFTVIGIIFLLTGLYTKNSLKSKEETYGSLKEEFNRVYDAYMSKYPVDSFYKRHKIKLDELDEGAKYFALMDALVKECKSLNMTENEKMINTVAEKVYHQL
jgi:hypothetical protein